jgi:hypothetical protein
MFSIYMLKVLGDGKVLECASPHVLLCDSNSHFSSLVKQTGSAEAEHLRVLANSTRSTAIQKEQSRTSEEELLLDGNESDPFILCI